jgi:hypothetical protein
MLGLATAISEAGGKRREGAMQDTDDSALHVPDLHHLHLRDGHVLALEDIDHQAGIYRIGFGAAQGGPAPSFDIQGIEDEHLIALGGEWLVEMQPGNLVASHPPMISAGDARAVVSTSSTYKRA